MSKGKRYLFTIDLKIEKQIVKLLVYEEDSQNDLVQRLSGILGWKDSASTKIKEKLQKQFRNIIKQDNNCSGKVKGKLEQLLEESKLIIIGISQTQKNSQQLDETPFKILQQTSNLKRNSNQKKERRQYNYLAGQNMFLNEKYPSKQFSVSNNHQKQYQLNFKKQIIEDFRENKGYIHSNNYQNADKKDLYSYSSSNTNTQRGQYSNNIWLKKNYQQLKNNPRELYQIQNNHQKGVIRKYNNREFKDNITEEQLSKIQSFQDYKVHRNKSQSNIPHQPSRQYLSKRIPSNQYLVPSKSTTKIEYNMTKYNYDNQNEINRRVGGKIKQKYHYLQQDI